MLSVSGLVNYMGKIDLPVGDAEAQGRGIAVKPVLLRKGNSKLGLYGIGNVKDARMHFELRSNRVRMFMPKDNSLWKKGELSSHLFVTLLRIFFQRILEAAGPGLQPSESDDFGVCIHIPLRYCQCLEHHRSTTCMLILS